MSTKVLDKNQYRIPFFGEKMRFIRGLDPLGLQLSSQRAYSYLLPGLNNVTGRIRYYSFYCWLLNEYSIRIGSTNPAEQKRFIRRAEYIIALSSQFGNLEGISGSNYAKNIVETAATEFDLQKGTYNSDGSTDGTYWKYSFGIFGQYYLGSLRQIGLVSERDINAEVYARTSKREGVKVTGEDLAEAFNNNISPDKKQVFFNAISDGKISKDQLLSLLPDFDLTKVPTGSKEQDLLIELLIDKDEPLRIEENPVTMRKRTLIQLLKYIETGAAELSDRAFVRMAYNEKGRIEGEFDDCLLGWYFYQCNEYWQYSSTAILNGLLDILQTEVNTGWMYLPDLVEVSVLQILDFLKEEKFISDENITLQRMIERDLPGEEDLYKLIKTTRETKRAAYGFLLILKLYKENSGNLGVLKTYINSKGLSSPNDIVTYLIRFNSFLTKSIREYIEAFLYNRIIFRHQFVAFNKIGGGTQTTQKFIIEDNKIRHIANFEPVNTGPRIANLISFLKDLGIINSKDLLSERGKQLLISI